MSPTPHESHTPEVSPLSPTTPAVPAPKKSLLWPVLLMIAPGLLLIATILMYAVINFIATATADSAAADGQLFAQPTPMHSFVNIVLFLLGSLAILGLVPCFIIGLVLLIQRMKK